MDILRALPLERIPSTRVTSTLTYKHVSLTPKQRAPGQKLLPLGMRDPKGPPVISLPPIQRRSNFRKFVQRGRSVSFPRELLVASTQMDAERFCGARLAHHASTGVLPVTCVERSLSPGDTRTGKQRRKCVNLYVCCFFCVHKNHAVIVMVSGMPVEISHCLNIVPTIWNRKKGWMWRSCLRCFTGTGIFADVRYSRLERCFGRWWVGKRKSNEHECRV